MPRLGASSFSFPEFRGATRRLVLVNLATFFALLLAGVVAPAPTGELAEAFQFRPDLFLHGYLWQPFTYSFIHPRHSRNPLRTGLSVVHGRLS
jgi:membrane associated rhomboid family serine protease